jgi:hypothetical protein
MYTIRPRSAGVIGFAGPPHDDRMIASIVTTASFNRLDDLKWPKIVCTDEMRGSSRVRILAKDFRRASHARRSEKQRDPDCGPRRPSGRDCPSASPAGFQAKLDRFANILERLFASPSLADAPWNNGTLGDQETVFARGEDHR